MTGVEPGSLGDIELRLRLFPGVLAVGRTTTDQGMRFVITVLDPTRVDAVRQELSTFRGATTGIAFEAETLQPERPAPTDIRERLAALPGVERCSHRFDPKRGMGVLWVTISSLGAATDVERLVERELGERFVAQNLYLEVYLPVVEVAE